MESQYFASPHSLPSGSSVICRDSSFFSRNGKDAALPGPSELMAQSAVQAPSDQHRTTRQLVYFEEIGLLVKYGIEPKVNIAEGQCHWALRQQVPGIPVPEIYGWLKDGDLTFLFLEPVHGITLEKIWTSLSRPERTEICTQLRSMLKELRDLRQDPGQQFIGDISRGPLADIVFTNGNLPRGGPFADVKEFHDWLSSMLTRGK